MHTGYFHRPEGFQTGVKNHRFGVPWSDVVRRKIIETHKKNIEKTKIAMREGAKHRPPITEHTRKKRSLSLMGHKVSEETKKKIGVANRQRCILKREKQPNNYISRKDLRRKIRNLFESRQWRSDVFTRDDFTCQFCKQRGGNLHVDHIKPFWLILDSNHIKNEQDAVNCAELWNINNGRTLCIPCHKTTESYMKRPTKSVVAAGRAAGANI